MDKKRRRIDDRMEEIEEIRKEVEEMGHLKKITYKYNKKSNGIKVELVRAVCPECDHINEYEVDQYENIKTTNVCSHFQGYVENRPETAIFEVIKCETIELEDI